MIKQFFSLMRRYIAPYRKYLTWALILNFVSQWLNVFSFAAIIPILNILFKIDTKTYEYIPMEWNHLDKDVLINNAYYYISQIIYTHGAFITLIIMGCILIVMTLLKTAGYFASSAVMVPLRTGIVRDIRIQVYNKVLRLPLSFFSEERKGEVADQLHRHADPQPDSLARVLHHPVHHQLEDDPVRARGTASGRMDHGYGEPQAETSVHGGTVTVGRHHVPARRDVGRTAHHQGFHCRTENGRPF